MAKPRKKKLVAQSLQAAHQEEFTDLEIVVALNEWMRRYIEEPEKFAVEFRTVAQFVSDEAGPTPDEPDYGISGLAYICRLLAEIRTAPRGVRTKRQLGLTGFLRSPNADLAQHKLRIRIAKACGFEDAPVIDGRIVKKKKPGLSRKKG